MNALTETLAQHGLAKASRLNETSFHNIQNSRPPVNLPLTWEQLQTILHEHPWAEPHLYVSTGFDPLVILNTNTGEYLNPQILLYADAPLLQTQLDAARKHVTAWAEQPTLDDMLDQNDTGTFIDTVDRSIILAPNPLKELVYQFIPWDKADAHNLADYHRVTALRVRKYEEYPSREYDRMLVSLLRATKPTGYGDPPEEETLTGVITVYRGEIDHSNHLALSWTRLREIAEGFARRFGMHGVVYEAQVPADRILAAYANDTEREVLIDDLSGIEIIEHRM